MVLAAQAWSHHQHRSLWRRHPRLWSADDLVAHLQHELAQHAQLVGVVLSIRPKPKANNPQTLYPKRHAHLQHELAQHAQLVGVALQQRNLTHRGRSIEGSNPNP